MKGPSTCRDNLIGGQRKAAGAGRPESDRACASEELEGERRRGQTSVESCKSTWRAVRFLSRRDGQKREAGLWLQPERADEE